MLASILMTIASLAIASSPAGPGTSSGDASFFSLSGEDLSNEIIASVVTAIIMTPLGYFARVWHDRRKDRRRLERILSTLGTLSIPTEIAPLGSAPEAYAPGHLTVTTSGRFVVPFPEDLQETLRAVESERGLAGPLALEIHDAGWLGGSPQATEAMTGIPDLLRVIATAARTTAERFIDRKRAAPRSVTAGGQGHLFNGIKYGLNSCETHFRTSTASESPTAQLSLFKTDYFTDRVMREVQHDLKARPGFDFDFSNPFTAIERYRPFICGIGLNAVLVCRGSGHLKGQRVLLLTRRSGNVDEYNLWYHISMNEALSHTDEDYDGVSLKRGFRRGFLEELGLTEDVIDEVRMCDLALACDHMAFFITGWCETSLDFETVVSLPARDKTLETDQFVQLPLDRREIRRGLEGPFSPMIPHGRFTLDRALVRILS